MADGDRQLAFTTGAVPTSVQVSGPDKLTPKSVNASFNGTGAAGAFLPCLIITGRTGLEVARIPAPQVAAGASAEVSWFPRVGAKSDASVVLPGTSVNRSVTSQTIPNNNSTDASFDTVLFDTLGWFDPVHPTKITVDAPGQYLVVYTHAWIYPATGGFPIETGVGYGSPAKVGVSGEFGAIASTPNAASGSCVVGANAGDSFTMFLYQASGGNMHTWVAGSFGADVQSLPTLSVLRIGDHV